MAYIQDWGMRVQAQPQINTTRRAFLHLSQNENGRMLNIKITDVDIPTGSTAVLAGTKPDGTVYSQAGTLAGNTATFAEDVQMTAVAGTWDAKITITNGGNCICTARITITIDPDTVAGGAIPSDSQLDGIIAECRAIADSVRKEAYGSPLVADAVEDMTDQSRVYVYTGSESGMTAGHWYYYNGTAWADGGVYNAVAVDTDTTLSIAGKAADAKKVGDELADLNSEGTVPTSEQMLSDNYTEDSVPYHFRKTASDNADREELEIVGGSVAWNQLEKMNRTSGTLDNGIEYTNNGDGSFILNGTATSLRVVMPSITNTSADVINGHVYLAVTNIASPSQDGVSVGIHVNNVTKIVEYKATAMYKPTSESGPIQIGYRVAGGAVVNNLKIYGGLFDLTAMFGSTIADHIYSLEQSTAGAGVALFRSLFNRDYYAYDAGSMQSVGGLSEHRTVGFNQWDEEWEAGSISKITGNANAAMQANTFRSKNYNKCLPNTTYFLSRPYAEFSIYWYDANNNYISYYTPASLTHKETISPTNARYFKIDVRVSGTYNHDICINLSDPSKNGQYEPYDGHTYALDDSLTLRGVPTLVDGKIKFDGDIYSPSGKVTRRYGIVDLGTLTWSAQTDSVGQYFRALVSGIKPAVSTTVVANILCSKYPTQPSNDIIDKSVGLSANASNPYLFIRDTSYSDAASFKAAMSGVYLVYELATPTTEQADPYIGIQSCHYDGTEEFVSTGIVPIGHNTKYPDNMRMKLDGLPWNFARLIAPVEDTFKATRNYDTGRRLIINNVLYIATANIANNANIVVGSNVRETNIDELLAELAQ